MSTLADIRTKVRRLTRSPSTAQITDAEIDAYINAFVKYDFPSHLRLFSLRITETTSLQPNIESYEVAEDVISIHNPVYVDGRQAYLTQSREEFYRLYSQEKTIASIGVTGDGVTTDYVGVLANIPVLTEEVSFVSIDANGIGMQLVDNGIGGLAGDVGAGLNTIDYMTGAYQLSFVNPPDNDAAINSHTLPYIASRPNVVLYYSNALTVRPVPDQIYELSYEVYKQPTELIAVGQPPELEQWWQYIAYGAAKKVYEDRMDLESVALILPEFKQQELLVTRKTIDIQTKERVATIYTDQTRFGNSGSFNGYL